MLKARPVLMLVLAGALAAVAACGTTASPATPSVAGASATATPGPPPHPLEFAVVLLGNTTQNGATSNAQVTILDPQGGAHGQASFAPPGPPQLPDAAAVTQLPVLTSAGAVYYADSQGNINRLSPDAAGGASAAAGVPLSGQQQFLSFAVSPDGGKVDAMILQLPALMTNCPGLCGFQPGMAHLTLYAASSGGPATPVTQRDISTDLIGTAPRMFAWLSSGPVGLDDAATGTQSGFPGYQYPGWGHAHVLMSNGQNGNAIGGTNCNLIDLLTDGTALCTAAKDFATPTDTLTVVKPSGGTAFTATATTAACAGCMLAQVAYMHLSPDGTKIALAVLQQPPGSNSFTVKGELIDSSGAVTPLADGFQPEGWLDNQTLIGTTDQTLTGSTGTANQASCPQGDAPGNNNLSLLKLSNPTATIALNRCGYFAGLVRPAS